jgi:hypothetical protein
VTGGEVDRDDVDEGRQRHGEQCAGDAGDHRAAGDDENDSERVHLDGRPHEERLEHVPLELLDAEDDHEHPQRDPGPVVDEGEEDGEGPGDDRTDERDERPEEDEDADRDREEPRAETHRARCRSRRWSRRAAASARR